jgi:predicted amidohydrolase YtcJ
LPLMNFKANKPVICVLKNNSMRNFYLLLAIAALAFGCKPKATLIVHNANIYTVNDSFSTATAMVIKDGKILAVGDGKSLLEKYSADSVVDAQGKTILPGLIDAHCHFTGFATDSWKCNLFGTASFEEVVQKISDYSKNAPLEWIYGRGWDQNDWANKAYPTKEVFDKMFPNRPVFLKRVDGHAALLNQKALDIAGITTATKIEGGEVEVKNGKLTGILIDNAMHFAETKVPLISDSLAIAYYLQMQETCFGYGLTGVHDCGVSEHTVDLIQQAHTKNNLKMKLFALLSDSVSYYEKWIKSGPLKTERLTVGGFKFYADGALGSRGACLIQDYTDKKGWKGFLLHAQTHFEKAAQLFANSNLQMCTHAIGDSGNRVILNIYAKVLKEKNDKRWRIEHAQVVDEADFNYFKKYNILPSVQPTHATSDMYWAEERIGKNRIKNAYAYKKLLQTNGYMPLGTDFPVEDISPIKTFFAAVVRQDAKGFPAGGFEKENALTRQEALRGMTIWAAKSAFEEKEKGSIEVGKAADFIMIDRDIMKCAEQEILGTQVLQTFVNGEKVWRKP